MPQEESKTGGSFSETKKIKNFSNEIVKKNDKNNNFNRLLINLKKTKSRNLNKNDKNYDMDLLSPEQRQRREFLESKKKWICKEDFHRVFNINTTSIKVIPNIMSYGKSVSDYKYRDLHPDRWITPNGFK